MLSGIGKSRLSLLTALLVLLGGASLAVGLSSAHALRPLSMTVTDSTVAAAAPSSIYPGDELTVAAEGFRGRVAGTLTWNGSSAKDFVTDVHGRIVLNARVPLSATGSVRITAAASGRSVSSSVTVGDVPQKLPPLTWAPPSTSGYARLLVDHPGTYSLASDVDYVVSSPALINGGVHLQGGRNIVWIGGHIRVGDQGPGPVTAAARRGLVVSDHDDLRGNPRTYGYSKPGRIVHLEGLLIDGQDLAEGINTNAPSAILDIENVRVDGVHFRNSDDRDGAVGWSKNHPDALQTWGSQRELRVDGLTATSAYQGIFLKEDAPDSVRGPVWMRRVDVRAIEHTGDDGTSYAGHRMFSWYRASVGTIHLDADTVRVQANGNSGWNEAVKNPAAGSGTFWRGRYFSVALSRHIDEPPPGGATFADALGNERPLVTSDGSGTYAQWGAGVLDWSGRQPGRVYQRVSGAPDNVPSGTAGLRYQSPGYVG